MRNLYYKLEGQKVVPVNNMLEWAAWYEKAERRIAFDQLGRATVSTVFLGLDTGSLSGEPRVFETALFLGSEIQEHDIIRSSTYQEAITAHRKLLGELTKNSN